MARVLAAYVVWHVRRAWAPLNYTDPSHPPGTTPSPPTARFTAAAANASRHRDPDDQPLRSFRGLLDHLATPTRNDLRYGDTGPVVPTLTVPTDFPAPRLRTPAHTDPDHLK